MRLKMGFCSNTNNDFDLMKLFKGNCFYNVLNGTIWRQCEISLHKLLVLEG